MILDEESAKAYAAERCDDCAMRKLDTFVELLIAETERQNLVARTTIPHIWVRHIADSLQLIEHVPRETKKLARYRKWGGVSGAYYRYRFA